MAPVDRGLNEHRAKVRGALIPLLTETVTDMKHQEVLRRVLGPGTKFDKPILNFDNPNLAPLVKYPEFCVGDPCMQQRSGALGLEAHLQRGTRTTS